MSDSYTNLLYHIVFSTKDRRPLITPDKEVRLYDYVGGIVRSFGGISLALNGTEDHLHLFKTTAGSVSIGCITRLESKRDRMDAWRFPLAETLFVAARLRGVHC